MKRILSTIKRNFNGSHDAKSDKQQKSTTCESLSKPNELDESNENAQNEVITPRTRSRKNMEKNVNLAKDLLKYEHDSKKQIEDMMDEESRKTMQLLNDTKAHHDQERTEHNSKLHHSTVRRNSLRRKSRTSEAESSSI